MRPHVRFSFLTLFIFSIFTFSIQSQPCIVPDNGTGTATLPPIGCDYSSQDEVWYIIDGLPAGSTIELDGPLTDLICCDFCLLCSMPLPPGECEGVGSSLGGNFHCFEATLDFDFNGTGDLAGFNRHIAIPVFVEVHTGPRNPGDPVQTFPAEIYRMQGQLFGDPDFCDFTITAGIDYGLPGPGETTLTDLGGGLYNIDSFFDITYQIDFVGCPGSLLDGMAGTTTATITGVRAGEPYLPPIPLYAGDDQYTSPCGTIEFGENRDYDPIYADFFGPGSDPFDGIIALVGQPSDGSQFPQADVIISRPSDILIEPGMTETVPIEMIQLSLKSTDPIKVTYGGGMTESFFDVFVELEPGFPSTGTTDITQIDDYGGEFDYVIELFLEFTFIEVGTGANFVFSPGGWGINYTSGPNLWTLSPISGEFDVVSDERVILQSAAGTTIELLPLPIRFDDFLVAVDELGSVEFSDGTGWNGGEWYYYPEYPWTNVWFYNHPYTPDRRKIIDGTMTLEPRDPGIWSEVEIVWNWTTPNWPGWPDVDHPPLPEDINGDEDEFIVRSDMYLPNPFIYTFSGIIDGPIPVQLTVPYEILDYNPEWLSVDIRGSNFILSGDFQHICWTEGSCTEQDVDFGDAPDPTYPTLLASDGARHIINPNVYMGILIDSEPDGWQDPNALGDDLLDGNDDEDGVIFNPLYIGTSVDVDVTVSVDGYINAWIDFDIDGGWAEPNDQIFFDEPVTAGPNTLTFNVPAGIASGSTFARFRFNTVGGLTYTGLADDGEVEDYMVDITTVESSYKWEQLPDLSPTGMDVDATFNPIDPEISLILADDFLCTETGNITDIHIWGSWLNDHFPFGNNPAEVQFTFSIHADIPAGVQAPWSMPGEVLWTKIWIPTPADFELIDSGPEDWYNPFIPMWLNDNHFMAVKYNYILDPEDYFYQTGTEQDPIVYWLDVQAMPLDIDPECRFGWKTSLDHWNDDAVWTIGNEPYFGPWEELRYPPGHEMELQSIDLAFVINEEEPTDEYDFGDAPEDALAYPSLGVVGNFPTCVGVPVAGWIEHQTTDLFFMPWFDLENEGNAGLCPTFNPNQYNHDECFADGDAGLMFPDGFTIVGPVGSETVQPCAGANNQHLGYTCQQAIWGTDIDIEVHNNLANGSYAYLNILVDWNQDGQWSGFSNCPGGPVQEHVLVDFPIPHGYIGPVSPLIGGLPLPIGPNPGYVWVRFSLTEVMVDNGWNGEGSFEDGETEDYLLLILEQEDELDFGDASDLPYPTLLPNGARHIIDPTMYLGNIIDPELDGQPDPNALGDDNDGTDDEDGVIIIPALSDIRPGGNIWYDVQASSVGFLSIWIDWDANGSWGETDNLVLADWSVASGPNSTILGIPPTAVIGDTYARFRFSSMSGLSYTGQAPDGEVEDYEITIGGDVDVILKAFLEGPFNGTNMNTDLNSGNLIPLGQPYNSNSTAPWYYTGTESVVSIPNPNVVDWVMVEFRDAPSPAAATSATMVSQQAAFILADGSVVALDGVSPVKTNGIFSHNLYVVIWHRNHLGIMSSGPIVPTGINQYTYDFTGGPGQAYLNGQKNLGGGIYGLAGGDGKPDGFIDNQDIISIWTLAAGATGYIMVDYNLDTQVDNQDKNNIWYPNIGSGSQVP